MLRSCPRTFRTLFASSALVLGAGCDAPKVYADYVAGLSGPTTAVPDVGIRATSAPDVLVAPVGDSVVVIGRNDAVLARQIARRL